MKNELEESWNKHKHKAPHMSDLYRDRYNFQMGFNAAFRLFGKPNTLHPDLKHVCLDVACGSRLS